MNQAEKSIKLDDFPRYTEEEMIRRSDEFFGMIRRRRSVRHFSTEPVSRSVIENCIRSAATAPSGANMQPWQFVVVMDKKIKAEIRRRAEEEEREFYDHRAPDDWLEALTPLGTDSSKPFLEEAPYLIVIFAQRYHEDNSGNKIKHYYMQESVGIATGMLITALHHAGLATLTHTPSPMGFLSEILGRPDNEKPYLILVTGRPHIKATLPDIRKKVLSEVCTFV